jgi:hypothetical protein
VAEITQSVNSSGIRVEISGTRDFDFESIQICCRTQPGIYLIDSGAIFRMESEGAFMSCNLMSSLFGLTGTDVESVCHMKRILYTHREAENPNILCDLTV